MFDKYNEICKNMQSKTFLLTGTKIFYNRHKKTCKFKNPEP